MAQSDAEICNTALQRVGVTMTIDTLGQRVKEAMVCNQIYSLTRDRVLSAIAWPFCRKYQVLNLDSQAAPAKWGYRYIYPNDCLAVRAIFPDFGAGSDPYVVRNTPRQFVIPHEIVVNDAGDMTLCCDMPNAILEYTVRVTNPARFDAPFESAFAWAIAAEIALPLARDPKYSQNAGAMYRQELFEAAAKAKNEERREADPESEFVRERY